MHQTCQILDPAQGWISEGHWQTCPTQIGCICDPGGPTQNVLFDLERAWKTIAGAVFCICLQERDDRFRAACAEAHRVGLCRLLQFYRPHKPTPDELARASRVAGVKARGFFGSWESHRTVASRAIHCSRILILEDDFRVLHEKETTRTTIQRLVAAGRAADQLPAGWEVFYLGHMPAAGYPVTRNVFRTWSCWIHAYVLSPAGRRRLAATSYVANAVRGKREQTLDGFVMRTMQQYALFPQIIVQSGVGSDNLIGTDHYTQLVEWWVRVHRDHSFAIETAVLVLLPLLVLILVAFMLFI